MKAIKKYLAVMMTIFMFTGVMSATVYASTDEGDAAGEILDVVEAAPVPDFNEETGPELIETITEALDMESMAIIPDVPSDLDTGEYPENTIDNIGEEVPAAPADEIESEISEEVVGAIKATVGENIWAEFDSDTGAVIIGANYSQSGTLWPNWVEKLGVARNQIKSIEFAYGTVYLPANSSSLFYDMTNLMTVDFDCGSTENVMNIQDMFKNCISLKSITGWAYFDMSKVTNMSGMFYNCSSLTDLYLAIFNTSNVKDISNMFFNCNSLRTLNISSFDLSNVTNKDSVFQGCRALRLLQTPKQNSLTIDLPITLYNKSGTKYTALPKGSQSIVLAQDKELAKGTVVVGDCVTAAFTSSTGTVKFYSDQGTLWDSWKGKAGIYAPDIKSIGVAYGKVYMPPDSGYLFAYCSNLTKLDLSGFDTSNVTNMERIFFDCSRLTTLDLSRFDTSKVTNMNDMFHSCSSLTTLDLSRFDTSKVTDMGSMFEYCGSLANLDLSRFNTSNVTNMEDMFRNCSSLTNLDLSKFNTSNVESMYGMFYECISLTNLDLSKFNTSKVTNMSCMFALCDSLAKLDLSNFKTSSVANMDGMFDSCKSLTNLDLSSFNTLEVYNIRFMFYNCSSLTYLDLSSFDTTNVRYSSYTFDGCTSLEILRTPKKHTASGVTLPLTMYDTAGKKYIELPVLSKSIVLGKTQKIAQDFLKKPISDCTITLKPTSYTYDGKSKKPAVTVKDGTKVLTSGTDYTVAYSKNKNAGTAVVTITASETADYKGTATANFTIKKAAAGLAFAESSITKTTAEAAFTNPLTKTTTAAATFVSDNTAVAAVDSASGEVTIKGAGTATITAQTKAVTNYNAGTASYSLTVIAPYGFSDVQDQSHPFYNAIYWAAEAGITKGYPDGTFGINRDCTRGEMMMFLWRYAGKQEPTQVTKSPFKDVPTTHAFYKAILWGYQKGITKGYSDGTFGINRNVSRGECMMFLWRLKGKPAPQAVATAPFPDVPKSHAFYSAVLWGYQKKITTGFTSGPLKGKFGVDENCSRGQIVTFLYRARSL